MGKNAYVSGLGYLHELSHESVRFYLYFLVGFLVPFSIGHPQVIVGSVVNMMLIGGALETKSPRYMIPLIISPSLGVLSRGVIFGPLTPFLLMMVPFIWAGNAILVYLMHNLRGVNYWFSLLVSAVSKTGFLFLSAYCLVSMGVLPAPFLNAMGMTQLLTALVGGIGVFILYKSGVVGVLERGRAMFFS